MTKGEKTRLVWIVGIASILWMGAAAWFLFSGLSGDELGNHGSSAVKDRMASECFGTFRERYECKEAIIVQSGRDTFWNLAGRFLIVVVPPLIGNILLSRHLRRNPVQVVIERHADDFGDWKSRAKAHTAAAAHSPDEESDFAGPSRPLTIDDIAPRAPKSGGGGEPDWKRKAQSHTKQTKRPD